MNNTEEKVLIVGSGIAGLTMALVLQKAGIRTNVIEQAEKFEPLNTGIVLNLHALQTLYEIGVGREIENSGSKISRLKLMTARGRLLTDINIADVEPPYTTVLGLHRAELHHTLAKYLKETEIWLNTRISRFQQSRNGVDVTFSDGTQEHYSLVVGADGVHSQVRSLLFGTSKPVYAGYHCWRFLTSGIPDLEEGASFELWGRGKRFGLAPMDRNHCYCYAFMNCPQDLDLEPELRLDFLKKHFADFGWHVGGMLNKITPEHEILQDRIFNVRLNMWKKGRIILIGDAAHAMTPNFGQGAALAIEDAFQLSQYINFSSSMYTGLKNFQARRRPQVASAQWRGHYLGRAGQWESRIMTGIRNLFIRCMPDSVMLNIILSGFLRK